MLTDFPIFFTDGLNGKFATNSSLNVPSHIKRVAILPCEISVLKKLHRSRNRCSKLRCKTHLLKKSRRKIMVSLIFVDIKVKNNLHSNVTRAKAVSVRHR